MSAPPAKNKTPIIIGAVVAVVLLVAGAAYYFALNQSPKSISTSAVPTLNQSGLTAESVAALDKDATFWAYIKKAAQQQKLVTTHLQTTAASKDEAPFSTDYYKIGFDYQTKKFVAAHDDVTEATGNLPESRFKRRCPEDGKQFYKGSSSTAEWTETTDDSLCTLDRLGALMVDGVSAAGLTADQADKMVNYLLDWKGLTSVKQLQLAEKDGKKYLHYTFELTPIPTDGVYLGNQYWMWGFKQSGLDPATHPYGYKGAGGSGTHLEYYVDPDTALPVYAEFNALPLKDANGKDRPEQDYTVYKTRYDFTTSTFDASPTNNSNLSLDW